VTGLARMVAERVAGAPPGSRIRQGAMAGLTFPGLTFPGLRQARNPGPATPQESA
jgi:hypothetical protein